MLSTTMIVPGRKPGSSICSTYKSKISELKAPSIIIGAQIPPNRKALITESLLPGLNGSLTTARCPMGARAWCGSSPNGCQIRQEKSNLRSSIVVVVGRTPLALGGQLRRRVSTFFSREAKPLQPATDGAGANLETGFLFHLLPQFVESGVRSQGNQLGQLGEVVFGEF